MEDLSRADSILEPRVLSALKAYISNNSTQSKIKEAIQAIAKAYRNLPDMINLLCDWSVLGEVDATATVNDTLRQLLVGSFNPSLVAADQEHLWITHMINNPYWRSTLYQLAGDYPLSNPIKQAIDTISNEGLSTELAAAAIKSVSVRFELFQQVLRDYINATHANNQHKYLKAVNELKLLCSQTEYTYVYAHALLNQLSAHSNNGYFFKRIKQEISEHVLSGAVPNLYYAFAIILNTKEFIGLLKCKR
jgi:hypothetical protein